MKDNGKTKCWKTTQYGILFKLGKENTITRTAKSKTNFHISLFALTDDSDWMARKYFLLLIIIITKIMKLLVISFLPSKQIYYTKKTIKSINKYINHHNNNNYNKNKINNTIINKYINTTTTTTTTTTTSP